MAKADPPLPLIWRELARVASRVQVLADTTHPEMGRIWREEDVARHLRTGDDTLLSETTLPPGYDQRGPYLASSD